MKISVIIPTYNRWHTLPRALDSVLQQTQPAHEIIVVDDGSTDGTVEAVKQRYPNVKLIQQENYGVSHARNRGIELAMGDWIALLDSDDAWSPEKLAVQQQAITKDTVLCHTDEIWVRGGRRVNPKRRHQKRGGWIYEHCLPLCCISPSSVMIRRDILLAMGGFDEQLPACEDYDLWLRLTARYPVTYVDQPLITKYGGHEDQLSMRYWGMDRYRIRALQGMLESGALQPDQRVATQAMLRKKVQVYLQGAQKRGKQQEVIEYQAILEQCSV